MRFESKLLSVDELLKYKQDKVLSESPEYQRGKVWDKAQKKRLIDSLLRNYPLPLFYLHHKHWKTGLYEQHTLDVIDGQQRLNALEEFKNNVWELFDPKLDRSEARFPSFIEEQPCPWGRRKFADLPDDIKQRFMNTSLSTVFVEDALDVEARDLFIRLQAGLPLNPQEKRDAWPGEFTNFILQTAGKPEWKSYPGHPFFTKVMKNNVSDRGKLRQLLAQMYMLLESRTDTKSYCGLQRDEIDSFYYKHLDFEPTSARPVRVKKILDLVTAKLGDGKTPKLVNYEAISLFLLVHSLMDEYTPSWEDRLVASFDSFRASVLRYKEDPSSPYNTDWILPAKVGSDRKENIEKRHSFFAAQMLGLLDPTPKDTKRAYDDSERQAIYYRDKKLCGKCGGMVDWSEAEFHHVLPHSKGGLTILSNGALVHKSCHPLADEDVAAFAEKWTAHSAG